MKKLPLVTLLLSCWIFTTPLVAAHFDKMPKDVVQMSKILSSLEAKGFGIVKKIEFDNGLYIAKALNSEGKVIKIRIDAKTGEIIPMKKNPHRLSALEVAKKVEQAGYHNIHRIDTEWFHDRYEVKAFDKNGKKVELDIDAKTGEIK